MALDPTLLLNYLIAEKLGQKNQLPPGYLPTLPGATAAPETAAPVAATPATPKVALPPKAQEQLDFINMLSDPSLMPHASEKTRARFFKNAYTERFGVEEAQRAFGKEFGGFGKKSASRELEEKKVEGLAKDVTPIATPPVEKTTPAQSSSIVTPSFDEEKLLQKLESDQ